MHVCMYVCMFENFLDNFGKYIQTHPNHIHRHGHTNTKNSSYLGHPRTQFSYPLPAALKIMPAHSLISWTWKGLQLYPKIPSKLMTVWSID